MPIAYVVGYNNNDRSHMKGSTNFLSRDGYKPVRSITCAVVRNAVQSRTIP